MKEVQCIETSGITSGVQLSELMLRAVQGAILPEKPTRATEWLFQVTLVDLNTPWRNSVFPRMEEGCWRMLLIYALEDLAEHKTLPLVISDLTDMLNRIKFEKGREEVLAVCNALQGARRLFPEVFLATQ